MEMKRYLALSAIFSVSLVLVAVLARGSQNGNKHSRFLGSAETNSQELISQGQQTFRFDTFGDEAFWGGTLQLQQAINALKPTDALSLGLKVDSDALTPAQIKAIQQGKINLNLPSVTVQLIKQNAVLGVVGFFNGNTLNSVGLTCALCHSTVDNSIGPGIGKRIDGLANRDLNVGAIVAAAPNLQPVVDLLQLAPADAGLTVMDVRKS
jgi:hypothetical protein